MKALILNFLFCKYLKLLIKLVLNCHFNSIKMQTSNLITKLYLFSVSKATTCAVKQLKILIFVLKTEKLSKLTHTSAAFFSLLIHFFSTFINSFHFTRYTRTGQEYFPTVQPVQTLSFRQLN